MKMLYDFIAGIISMIAKSLGVSYATANVAWSLYLQGLVCILSCLLLLIPMRKRYKQFGLDVFTISGTASVLGYTYLIFSTGSISSAHSLDLVFRHSIKHSSTIQR